MTASHEHLWSAPDGTGLHAPYGQLAVEDGTGRLCCHLCGRWWRALGSHVRVHGHSAASYRAAVGLAPFVVLAAPDVTQPISARQRAQYYTDPQVRENFATGQAMARTGELTARARAASRDEGPAEQVARRSSLARGRATMAGRRQDQLRARLGTESLSDYLQRRYAGGASLEVLAAETGLGRARLAAAMSDAGIMPRRSGSTTPAGRRSRAIVADQAAAAQVGTADLRGWLTARRAEGQTLTELGRAVGHSGHWVKQRLADASTDGPPDALSTG